jgi:hypothetical protein
LQANKLARHAALPGHDDAMMAPSYDSQRINPSSRLAARKNKVVNACGR